MKENDKIGYVYLTTNLLNGKQYVGQHLHDGFDKGYKGSGIAITNAINKYGWDNFKCEVLCWCGTQTQLNEAEDNYIKLLGTMSPNGYNLKGGGSKGKPCKESRVKLSESLKKRYANPEERKKTSEASKKIWKNEETHKKASEAQTNRYKDQEERKKTSEAIKKYWMIPESFEKQSKIQKKNWESKERHITQSKALKKYWESEENRKKRSKPVIQYTLDGEFIKEWSSATEIKRVLGFDQGYISACCRGEHKHAYNFLWKFAS